MVEVVRVNVGDQRYRGVVEQEGSVGFVCLDDEQLALAVRRADSKRLDDAAIDKTGILAERQQRGDDHARRCGLAVRTRDGNEPLSAD